jgi:hypothetical protein
LNTPVELKFANAAAFHIVGKLYRSPKPTPVVGKVVVSFTVNVSRDAKDRFPLSSTDAPDV